MIILLPLAAYASVLLLANAKLAKTLRQIAAESALAIEWQQAYTLVPGLFVLNGVHLEASDGGWEVEFARVSFQVPISVLLHSRASVGHVRCLEAVLRSARVGSVSTAGELHLLGERLSLGAIGPLRMDGVSLTHTGVLTIKDSKAQPIANLTDVQLSADMSGRGATLSIHARAGAVSLSREGSSAADVRAIHLVMDRAGDGLWRVSLSSPSRIRLELGDRKVRGTLTFELEARRRAGSDEWSLGPGTAQFRGLRAETVIAEEPGGLLDAQLMVAPGSRLDSRSRELHGRLVVSGPRAGDLLALIPLPVSAEMLLDPVARVPFELEATLAYDGRELRARGIELQARHVAAFGAVRLPSGTPTYAFLVMHAGYSAGIAGIGADAQLAMGVGSEWLTETKRRLALD